MQSKATTPPTPTPRRPSVLRNCEHCGAIFRALQSNIDRGKARFCSQICGWTHRHLPLADRFWLRIDQSGGPDACWPWLGPLSSNGYGQIGANGTQRGIHVVAWELTHGSVPPGMMVCHSCDVRYPVSDKSYRRCGNPGHLFLGTCADNLADMAAKGRAVRGERHHKAKNTDEQVIALRRDHAAATDWGRGRRLAAKYGISESMVSSIVHRRSWRHLTP